MSKIAIIGSGPGASVVCRELAKYDVDITVFEAGKEIDQAEITPFSTKEIDEKYEGSGTTALWGNKIVNFGAAKCFGGGSEINAGLYYRTPGEKIADWAKITNRDLANCFKSEDFEEFEKLLNVCYSPDSPPKIASKFIEGAKVIGFDAIEVPRWVKYQKTENGYKSYRQSMQEVVWKKLKNRIKFKFETFVEKISHNPGSLTLYFRQKNHLKEAVFDYLFVCAGAIHTPYILMRSGLLQSRFIAPLSFHPTVKVLAKFDHRVDDNYLKVPSHQIKLNGKDIGLGVSITNPELVKVSMIGIGLLSDEIEHEYRKYGLYYCMTKSDFGNVLNLPGLEEPFPVHYMKKKQKALLAEGVNKLKDILYSAGATEVKLVGSNALFRQGDICYTKHISKSDMLTIHLMSSCPLWVQKSPISKDGHLKKCDRIFVADSSIIPNALGVNPQGTVMILSKHIVTKFIEKYLR